MIAAAHRVTFINKDEAPVNEFMGDGQIVHWLSLSGIGNAVKTIIRAWLK